MQLNNKLAVLILNRNHANDVLSIYESMKGQSFQDFHVIVIDDNSDKSQLEKLLAVKDERFMVYCYPEPWKFGHDNEYSFGLNIALRNNAKYVHIFQTDMQICSDDLFEKLVEHMENNENCGIVGPTITRNGNIVWGAEIEKFRMGLINNVSESYMIRTKCIREMGRITNRLRYFGTEHYHKFWMRENGYTTISLGDISVEHAGGGTSSSYQYYKHYYRPRTTILLMKLFLKDLSLMTKVQYFYYEMSEPINYIIKSAIRLNVFRALKIFLVVSAGIIVGILKKVDEEERY